MSRKYSSWASNQPLTNADFVMRKLNTVIGNEQDQCKSSDFFIRPSSRQVLQFSEKFRTCRSDSTYVY